MLSTWTMLESTMNGFRTWLLTLVLSATASPASEAQCQRIRVAAASDLQVVMPRLVANFEKGTSRTGIDVSYGSSGNFVAQIQNGAPFDLFFSADVDYAKKLEQAGRAVPGSLYAYATGRIVLWAARGKAIDFGQEPWEALKSTAVHRIAIANPEHAPYGRAAVAALKSAGIYDLVQGKLVFGENISQAAQFVQSGNAEVGVIALSLALSPAMAQGQRWEIPEQMYPPIVQAMVQLPGACPPERAREFAEFIKSGEAKQILHQFGFRTNADR